MGKTLLREAMKRGMLIDVDHMSAKSRAEALEIFKRYDYPPVSGHTGFVDISKGEKRHEGNLTAAEVETIRSLGGMISVIPAQGSIDEIDTWRGGSIVIEHVSGATSNTLAQAYLYAVDKMSGAPVGLGTDLNGFAGSLRPRFGKEAGTLRADTTNLPNNALTYPFVSPVTGIILDKSKIGERAFDFNEDGLAHVGMLPDLIADLKAMGVPDEKLAPLMNSAEGYVSV
jgi:microsomal dipeptidase-like Zn-dependent dipeptidase